VSDNDLSQNGFVFTGGVTKVEVLDADCNVWLESGLKETRQILRGCAEDEIEEDC